jgi:hypothetical protein
VEEEEMGAALFPVSTPRYSRETRIFFTDKTTCANVMLKRTTSKKIYQKIPPLGGGTAG